MSSKWTEEELCQAQEHLNGVYAERMKKGMGNTAIDTLKCISTINDPVHELMTCALLLRGEPPQAHRLLGLCGKIDELFSKHQVHMTDAVFVLSTLYAVAIERLQGNVMSTLLGALRDAAAAREEASDGSGDE